MITADKYVRYIFMISASLVKSPEHIDFMRVSADCMLYDVVITKPSSLGNNDFSIGLAVE